MNEQAAALQEYIRRSNLNRLVDSREAPENDATRVFTVSSGKGGVGKSTIALNLGISAPLKTLVVDGDFLLGNLGVMLNTTPGTTWENLIVGRRNWKDALFTINGTTDLLGAESFDSESSLRRILSSERLTALIREWRKSYELIVVDTSAGLSTAVVEWCLAATHAVVVTTPDPSAITDAYALIKSLVLTGAVPRIGILVNQYFEAEETELVSQQLLAMVRKYLQTEIAFWGGIPWEKSILQSAREQRVAALKSRNNALFHSFARIYDAMDAPIETVNAMTEATG